MFLTFTDSLFYSLPASFILADLTRVALVLLILLIFSAFHPIAIHRIYDRES